jgi:hypothetical protein
MFVPSQRLPSVSRLQNQSRGKRSRKRRLGLESIERRMVLSAVHGASAADAAAEGVIADFRSQK